MPDHKNLEPAPWECHVDRSLRKWQVKLDQASILPARGSMLTNQTLQELQAAEFPRRPQADATRHRLCKKVARVLAGRHPNRSRVIS